MGVKLIFVGKKVFKVIALFQILNCILVHFYVCEHVCSLKVQMKYIYKTPHLSLTGDRMFTTAAIRCVSQAWYF